MVIGVIRDEDFGVAIRMYMLHISCVLLGSSSDDLQHALGRFAAECETTGMTISTSKYEAKVLSKGRVNTCDVCRTADAVAEYESKPFDLLINLCSYPNKI